MLEPGTKVVTGAWDAVSLGMALMFGTAGLPHILMRFYTVPNAKAARVSVMWATIWIGSFYLITFILGFGSMVLVGQANILAAGGGGNMAAPLLAKVIAGDVFFGFICAVAFATILAVVAGLTLAGAGALSHDLWVNVFRGGHAPESEQLKVARFASIILGVCADPARHRLPGAERRLHGRSDVLDRRFGQFPGAGDVGVLAAVHHLGGGLQHPVRHDRHPAVHLPRADDPGRPAVRKGGRRRSHRRWRRRSPAFPDWRR